MAHNEWPCGHLRTEENTQSVGVAGVRCRTCRQHINREYARRKSGFYARRGIELASQQGDG